MTILLEFRLTQFFAFAMSLNTSSGNFFVRLRVRTRCLFLRILELILGGIHLLQNSNADSGQLLRTRLK